jgi:uncharacterized nucleotidyltransferase DUF6036
MNQAPPILDPWKLVWGQPYIDSQTLAAAIEQDLERHAHHDFRTRLLVRDVSVALRSFWGPRRFSQWVTASPVGQEIRAILKENLGRPGFTAIRRRLVDSIDSPQVRQIFELLGRAIHGPVEVYIAGSIPTLIKGLTSRPTADIDFVNEIPLEIRRQRGVLRKIEEQYGLTLGHVQAHYLPAHWENRRQWLGDFGGLRVYVVDEYDIFVSKLSSKKEKHRLDLRVLALKLDRDTAKHRLLTDGQAFLDDPKLKPRVEENWRFIFQEPLFGELPARKAGEPGPAGEDPNGKTPRRGRPKQSRRKNRDET